MVKLNGPLMSQNASGAFAKNLTFQTRGNKKLVRRFHYPKKQPTGEQLAQRYIIGLLTARWQTMTASEKAVWNLAAKEYQEKNKKPMTGFNYWIKIAQTDLPTYYGMVAFYPMNEGTGRTVKDYSGNGFDISLLPASPAPTLTYGESENKSFDKCIVASGSAGYGLFPYDDKFSFTDKFSCFFWVKFGPKDSLERRIVSRVGYFIFSRLTDNSCAFIVYLNGISRGVYIPTTHYKTDVWYLCVGTFDNSLSSNQMKFYITPWRYASRTIAGTGTIANTSMFFCSASTSAYRFNGSVDNLCILNRVISYDEMIKIQNIMHSNKERQQLP